MTREDAPARLLVEGRDDKHSVIHLMKRHDVDWDSDTMGLPYVLDCGSVENVLESLPVSAKSYSRLGVIIDANDEIEARWTSVRSRLASANVNLPVSPDPRGTIVPGFYPDWRVGIWLMPDNDSHGALEDFLKGLVPTSDPCWAYAHEASRHAIEIGAQFSHKKFLKAHIHTWLSWQKEPGLPFGTAITAAFFTHDSPEALKFVEWFNQLFLRIP